MGWVMNARSVALKRCCLVFTSQILAAKSAAINPPPGHPCAEEWDASGTRDTQLLIAGEKRIKMF